MEKRISLFALFGILMISCAVIRRPNMNVNELNAIIDNYIVDFSRFSKNQKPESILIYVESQNDTWSKVVVEDYPLETMYQEIRKKKDVADSISFGTYYGIPFKLIGSTSVIRKLKSFIQCDSAVIGKASKVREFFDEHGNKLNIKINEELVQYDPLLTSTYDIRKKNKMLELVNGLVLNEKY